eukprot:365552-Chlamydomonas_euryale.AAC.3
MLSRTRYLRLAGTNVLRDFVELPSQLMEHWMEQPEVLRAHARHYKTGEAVPDALLDRLKAARAFNQVRDDGGAGLPAPAVLGCLPPRCWAACPCGAGLSATAVLGCLPLRCWTACHRGAGLPAPAVLDSLPP